MNDVDGAGLQGLTSLTVVGGGGERVTSKAAGRLAASRRCGEERRRRAVGSFVGGAGRVRGRILVYRNSRRNRYDKERDREREVGPNADGTTARQDPRNREGHGDRSAECLMRKSLQEIARRRYQLHDKGLA